MQCLLGHTHKACLLGCLQLNQQQRLLHTHTPQATCVMLPSSFNPVDDVVMPSYRHTNNHTLCSDLAANALVHTQSHTRLMAIHTLEENHLLLPFLTLTTVSLTPRHTLHVWRILLTHTCSPSLGGPDYAGKQPPSHVNIIEARTKPTAV